MCEVPKTVSNKINNSPSKAEALLPPTTTQLRPVPAPPAALPFLSGSGAVAGSTKNGFSRQSL